MKIQPWKSWPSKFTKIKQEKSYATAYAGAVFGYYVRRYHLDELKRELAKSNYHSIFVGCKFGNEKSFTKKSNCSKENSLSQAKNLLGFVKHFNEFAKGIYETRDQNFFNLAIIIIIAVVFSIVQFILFLHFASHN